MSDMHDFKSEPTTSSLRHRAAQRQPQEPLLSSPTSTIKIRESSPNGTHRQTHILDPSLPIITSELPPPPSSTSPTSSLLHRFLTPFLPTNYPHSVSADYTPYQIYDSIQAFASSIAGLLASRAVLTSLGVGGDTSNSATAATLLSIAQNSIGQFTSIFFAHYFAVQIEAEVKFYRFLADIVNDVAFVLDVLSPSLPVYVRIPVLCAASACRSVCGVCGGSSKAILSSHFARAGNIGELNAKDGSQETVVNLVGMWVGGVVVSRVPEGKGVLVWMLGLLGVHLWANWMAVRSVRLRTLNKGRAGMVTGRLLGEHGSVSIEDVGREESLFERADAIRLEGEVVGHCIFADVRTLLASSGSIARSKQGGQEGDTVVLKTLLDIFADEEYLLWPDLRTRHCIIVLKAGATTETQLKAWCHASKLTQKLLRVQDVMGEILGALGESLLETEERWKGWKDQLQEAGWDLSASHLAVSSGSRILVQTAS